MNADSGKPGTMLTAFLTFCIVAAAIFAGWHLVLRYALADPYKAPQAPYVSVTKAMEHHRLAGMEREFGRQIVEFWRFGWA